MTIKEELIVLEIALRLKEKSVSQMREILSEVTRKLFVDAKLDSGLAPNNLSIRLEELKGLLVDLSE